jgi:hypothetical protein
MLCLTTCLASWASLAAGLAFAGSAAAAVEDTFPREATRAEILRWLAGNSDLNPDSVVTMTDELVVAVTSRQDGRGVGRSTRLTLREEVINPDAAAAWGGRSIELDLDLDCPRHRVILGARRVYARPNLQGAVRITRPDNAWADVPGDTVIGDVERVACSSRPTQFAIAPPASDPATAAAPAAPAPASPAPQGQTAEAAQAPAPSPQVPDPPPAAAPQIAAAEPAPAPQAGASATVAARPASGVAVVKAAPELQKAAAPAVTHNPFVDTVAPARGPAPRTAAAPPQRLADYAVQIAAAVSADLARDSWLSLKARLPDLIGPRTFAVEPVSANGRTLYRALLLGFATPREAADLCKTLRSQSIDCILREMK